MLKRFVSRMYLPDFMELSHCQIKTIQSLKETINNKEQYWESYHVCDDDKVVKSIIETGFRIGPACNKGYGIYTAVHGRYALNWKRNCPVIVCLAKKTTTNVFHSEIFSPYHSFELVTSKPLDVIPIAIIHYQIQYIKDIDCTENVFQTTIGPVGCKKCDVIIYNEVWKRCDCKLICDLTKSDIVLKSSL